MFAICEAPCSFTSVKNTATKKFSITFNYSYSKGVRADLGTACVYCLDLREELVSALKRHFVYVYRGVIAVEHVIR